MSETTITIQRKKSFVGCAVRLKLYLDGKEVAKLGIGQKIQLTVPNGEHTISVGENVTAFTAAGEEMLFLVRPQPDTILFEVIQPALEQPEEIPVGWSKGKPNWTTGVFGAIIFFVLFVVFGVTTGINLHFSIGVLFTFLGAGIGYYLGTFIPIYHIGRKKTNLALSLFLALVMMVGLMYGLALLEVFPFMPKADRFFEGHIALLIAWLAISFGLSFFAVRNRLKVLLIVLSIIVAISYTNFILVLSTGKGLLDIFK